MRTLGMAERSPESAFITSRHRSAASLSVLWPLVHPRASAMGVLIAKRPGAAGRGDRARPAPARGWRWSLRRTAPMPSFKARVLRFDICWCSTATCQGTRRTTCGAMYRRPEEYGILMLTAAGALELVEGAGLGQQLLADQSFAELVARIPALARRSSPSRPPVLERGDQTRSGAPPWRRSRST